MNRIILSVAAVLLLATSASAQFSGDPLTWSIARQKAWLRSQIAASVSNPDALRTAVAKLEGMSDAQILALTETRSQFLRQQAYRNAAAQYYGNPYGGRVVGYRPVITTLPQGASLSAGAVVSPDRRYVRINATPFFSNIGPVRTFNTYNGRTRIYPNYAQPYNGLYGQTQQNRSSQSDMRVWYDGVRTRVGRR